MIRTLDVKDEGVLVGIARQHNLPFQARRGARPTQERLVEALGEVSRKMAAQGRTLSPDMLIEALSRQHLLRKEQKPALEELLKQTHPGACSLPDTTAIQAIQRESQLQPRLKNTNDIYQIAYREPSAYSGKKRFDRKSKGLWLPLGLDRIDGCRCNEKIRGGQDNPDHVHAAPRTLAGFVTAPMEVDDTAPERRLNTKAAASEASTFKGRWTDAQLDDRVVFFWQQIVSRMVSRMNPATCNKDFYLVVDDKAMARRAYHNGQLQTDSLQAFVLPGAERITLAMTRETAWKMAAQDKIYRPALEQALAENTITILAPNADYRLICDALSRQLARKEEDALPCADTRAQNPFSGGTGSLAQLAEYGQHRSPLAEMARLSIGPGPGQDLFHQKSAGKNDQAVPGTSSPDFSPPDLSPPDLSPPDLSPADDALSDDSL